MPKKPTKKKKKRTPKRTPTIKQRKALSNMVGNGGNATKAMLDAGYSKATANTPSKLTSSKAFQGLLEKIGINDKVLATKGKEFLAAKKPYGKKKISDYQIQHKAWETFLKLKGYLKGSSGDSDEETTELTNEELDRLIFLVKRTKWPKR